MAVDLTTMEFLQFLGRLYAIRGYPAVIVSDSGSQMVDAEREMHEIIRGIDERQLCEFNTEKGITWMFITPAPPHQNGCVEALVRSCNNALKREFGEQILTPMELHTYLLEAENLVNQRPIGRIPNDLDDGFYLYPNGMLIRRVTSEVPQGHCTRLEVLMSEYSLYSVLYNRL